MTNFAERIATWQTQHGRHDLPWQHTCDPYLIWLAEIMLQQTQVATVIPYYQRFIARFPTLSTLAEAPLTAIMPYWAGLGYYARARNLHRCAQTIMQAWQGRFPPNAELLTTLPGIGRSTAAAIAACAYGERVPILDGNVKRVFTRHFGIAGDPTQRAIENRLWDVAYEQLCPHGIPARLDMRAYTQGLMDLGATLCIRSQPRCEHCPVQKSCIAWRENRQAELPTPKIRPPSPTRHTGMLILQQNNHILFEQRAAQGIWGGLWSLPEFELDIAPAEACRRLGLEAQHIDELAPFTHTFTHFRLHIRPWHIIVSLPSVVKEETSRLWINTSAVRETALPAPVRKLMGKLLSVDEPHLKTLPFLEMGLKTKGR